MRAVHVAAVGGFLLAVAPRAPPRLLDAAKALVAAAAATDVALCLFRVAIATGRADAADAADDPEDLWLGLRALGALATGGAFAAVRAPALGTDGVGSAVVAAMKNDASAGGDPHCVAARGAAAAGTAAYLVAHGWLSLAEPSLEAAVSTGFHQLLLVGSFALWAALKCEGMALWLARTFAKVELCACGAMLAGALAGAEPAPGAWPAGRSAGLGAAAALLLAALAGVPETARSDSHFLAFDQEPGSEQASTGSELYG